MSSEDFFGPALPPGFVTHSNQASQSEAQEESDARKRKRSKARESSGSSQSDTNQSSSDSESSDDVECSGEKQSRQEPSSTADDIMRPLLPPQSTGPVLPPQIMGPALPPGFSSGSPDMSSSNFIGPVIPQSVLSAIKSDGNEDNDGDLVGPLPDSASEKNSCSALDELEARAQHMKNKLLGKVVTNFVL
jgi:hypothetical protein